MKTRRINVKFERERHYHTQTHPKQPKREISSTQDIENPTAMAAVNASTEEKIVTTFVLDIWWDIEIALPNGWYDTEWREY